MPVARELVTKVTFKVDQSSLGRTESAIKNLKRNLERLGTDLDSSLNKSIKNVQRNITKVSLSIRNLKRQINSINDVTNRRGGTNGGLGNLRVNTMQVKTSNAKIDASNVRLQSSNVRFSGTIQTPNTKINSASTKFSGTIQAANVRLNSANVRLSGNFQIPNAKINSAQTEVHGGVVNIHGFNPPNGNPTEALLNAIRNLRVMHADKIFIRGNTEGTPPPPGDGDNGDNGGNGGRGGNDERNRNSRLQNFIDHSGEMVAAGAGAIATVALPVREAMQFESAMADVKKVVDQTDEEFQQMGADIQDMSLEIPMKQGELAAIIAAGGQSGIGNENLLPFAKSAAKMGVAFDIEADQAGEMMAQWRTAFNMNQSGVIDLADKVNYLGNTTAASAPKISKVLTYVGALGEVAGVYSGEIAALGASIIGVGVAPEVTGTAIKNLMLALVAGEGVTTAQNAAFHKLGLESVELAKRMQVDSTGAILDFFDALAGLEDYERASTLSDILGTESIGAIAPLLNNLDNLKKNIASVSDANRYGENGWSGSMDAEFQARIATTESAMQLLENTFEVIVTCLGTELLPVLKELASAFMPIFKDIINFIREHQQPVGIILTVVGVLGTLLVALGSVGILLSGLMGFGSVFGAISGAFSGLLSALPLSGIFSSIIGVVMSALTPIGTAIMSFFAPISATLSGIFAPLVTALGGPVIAAILAVGTAIYFIYENWDALKAYFASSIPEIESAVETLKEAWLALHPAIEAIKPILSAIAQIIGGVLVGAIMILWEIGVSAFGAIASAAKSIASAISGVIGWIQSAIGWFTELIGLSDRAASVTASNAASAAASASAANYNASQTNYINVNSVEDATKFTTNSFPTASPYA